ncbi:MAG TPA: ferritin [Opitutaceae bacterium]|nr:ferritin [Opitutaceae bacterium]
MSAPHPEVIALLEKQLTHELHAAQSYLALAYWCDVEHWSGYSRFFLKQSGEEREHAARFLKHLADRDIVPKMGALEAPKCDYKDLEECARVVYELERANTRGIHECYAGAVQHGDLPAQVMLHWFINEQVEEEAWSDKLLTKTRRAACSGALQYLDRHLEKELAGEDSEAES